LAKFKDYYHVLGIAPRSHVRVIEDSYWEAAHELQRQPTRAAARKLRALNEAYEVLGTPHRRLVYDRQFAAYSKETAPDAPGGAVQHFFGMLAKAFRPG
jgi:curved DNA-binding protein CbpA